MKKNLIALAVAGVLVAPLAAQAEVTVQVSCRLKLLVFPVTQHLSRPAVHGRR